MNKITLIHHNGYIDGFISFILVLFGVDIILNLFRRKARARITSQRGKIYIPFSSFFLPLLCFASKNANIQKSSSHTHTYIYGCGFRLPLMWVYKRRNLFSS